MKRISIIFVFILTFQVMEAQNTPRNQAVAALNLYVDYCNETIHGLWSVSEELKGFNQDLEYNRHRPKDKIHLSFSNEDVFAKEWYYEIIPEKIYQNCLLQSKILGNNQPILNEKLNAVKSAIDRLGNLRDSVFLYVKQEQFKNDSDFEKIDNLLQHLENTFRQYRQAKNELISAVQQLYEKSYKPTSASRQQKIIQSANAFLPALQLCKKILDETLDNQTDNLPKYVGQMTELIAKLKTDQAVNLQNLYRFGRNNGLDPDWRYESVISDLEAFTKYAEDLLKSSGSDSQRSGYYKVFPKTFYFYNERLINKYNRYGLGVVQAFNKFINLAEGKKIQQEAGIDDYYIKNGSIKLDNSETVLLKWVEEPHQFHKMPVPGKVQNATPDVPVAVRPPELNLRDIEVGKSLRLENVIFKLAEAELLPESFADLNKILKFMQENPKVEILLEGHTDIIGNPDDNFALSEKRVKAIKAYLVQKDIAEKRIQTKWYGGTKPLKTTGTEEERKINRRVEFTVLKK